MDRFELLLFIFLSDGKNHSESDTELIPLCRYQVVVRTFLFLKNKKAYYNFIVIAVSWQIGLIITLSTNKQY